MRGQPPFGFSMPFVMMQGPMPQQGYGEAHPHFMPDAQVPARVKVAMEFMFMLQMKSMDRGAVAEGSGNTLEIHGKEPNTNEAHAEEAACELLAAYFRGKLEQDVWERQRHDAVQRRIEKEHEKKPDQQGHMTSCPACHGNVGLPCKLCQGVGRVLLSPILERGSFSKVGEENQGPSMPGMMSDMMGNPLEMMMRIAMAEAMNQTESETPPEHQPGPENEVEKPEGPSDPQEKPEDGPNE